MAFNKDNSGSLSRNQRKEKDSHPDMKGKATIAGVEYWISGWTKENEKGKWLSLSFEPKEDKPTPLRSHSGKLVDPDEQIPW